MKISEEKWLQYLLKLRRINDEATQKVEIYLITHGMPETDAAMNALIQYAYSVQAKYGEAAAEIAARMFDNVAIASHINIPPAVPAETATYQEVAKTITGTVKTGNQEIVSASVGRLVKRTGVDTTMRNAIEYGAEVAWIPHGDTCAFCIMLASNGWQKVSKRTAKRGHAQHIHANCDCTYAVRFDGESNVEGYNPGEYLSMYDSAEGSRWQDKVNSMRREFYQENREKILQQKRDLYARNKALNSSAAEEVEV